VGQNLLNGQYGMVLVYLVAISTTKNAHLILVRPVLQLYPFVFVFNTQIFKSNNIYFIFTKSL
jgi:hypothetical protein